MDIGDCMCTEVTNGFYFNAHVQKLVNGPDEIPQSLQQNSTLVLNDLANYELNAIININEGFNLEQPQAHNEHRYSTQYNVQYLALNEIYIVYLLHEEEVNHVGVQFQSQQLKLLYLADDLEGESMQQSALCELKLKLFFQNQPQFHRNNNAYEVSLLNKSSVSNVSNEQSMSFQLNPQPTRSSSTGPTTQDTNYQFFGHSSPLQQYNLLKDSNAMLPYNLQQSIIATNAGPVQKQNFYFPHSTGQQFNEKMTSSPVQSTPVRGQTLYNNQSEVPTPINQYYNNKNNQSLNAFTNSNTIDQQITNLNSLSPERIEEINSHRGQPNLVDSRIRSNSHYNMPQNQIVNNQAEVAKSPYLENINNNDLLIKKRILSNGSLFKAKSEIPNQVNRDTDQSELPSNPLNKLLLSNQRDRGPVKVLNFDTVNQDNKRQTKEMQEENFEMIINYLLEYYHPQFEQLGWIISCNLTTKVLCLSKKQNSYDQISYQIPDSKQNGMASEFFEQIYNELKNY